MITFTILTFSENGLSLIESPDRHRRIVPTPLVSIVTQGAEDNPEQATHLFDFGSHRRRISSNDGPCRKLSRSEILSLSIKTRRPYLRPLSTWIWCSSGPIVATRARSTSAMEIVTKYTRTCFETHLALVDSFLA